MRLRKTKARETFSESRRLVKARRGRLAGPFSERPVRNRRLVPYIVPTRGQEDLLGNLGGNAEFFVPYKRGREIPFCL